MARLYGERMFETGTLTLEDEQLSSEDVLEPTEVEVAEPETEWPVPNGLDSWEPGPFLAAVVGSLDPKRLTGYDLVVVLKATSRLISRLQADLYSIINEIGHRTDAEHGHTDLDVESSAGELAAALRLTRRTAEMERSLATALAEGHPDVLEALRKGSIDLRRARAIVDKVGHLDPDQAEELVRLILPSASRLTPGQLASRIQKLAIEVDPESAQKRRREKVMLRRVVTEPRPDGIGHIFGLDMPLEEVTAASRHINQLARSLKTAQEPRSLDQLRADVFLDLLTGRTTAGGGCQSEGSVNLEIGLTTLAGLDRKSAEIAGIGPITAEIGRNVAAAQRDGRWTWTVTHNGETVATGTTRRRPKASQHNVIRSRYPTCVFPGCRMPTLESDIDHRKPLAEGGATSLDNLQPLCRHHHVNYKHGDPPWLLKREEDGGHLWTSPLGHRYRTSGRDP